MTASRFAAPLALALLLPAPAPARAQAARGTLIVTNKSASTASLVDLATARVIAELPTGTGPHEVAASRDGRTAVVTDYGAQGPGGSTLTVIDVPGKRVARTIDLGSYTRPHGVAFLPGDSLVAVTSETTQNVLLVRVGDGTIVKAIPTGQNGSHMLAVTADGRTLWTGNIGSNTVSEIDLLAGRSVRMLPVPPQPEPITVSADGGEVWVGSNATGVVSVVHTADGRVETALSGLARPYRVLITSDRRHVLVPDFSGETLRVLDYPTRTERGRVSFPGGGPQGIAVTPDARLVFVSMSRQDRIALVSLDSLTIVGYVPTGSGPDGVAYSAVELR